MYFLDGKYTSSHVWQSIEKCRGLLVCAIPLIVVSTCYQQWGDPSRNTWESTTIHGNLSFFSKSFTQQDLSTHTRGAIYQLEWLQQPYIPPRLCQSVRPSLCADPQLHLQVGWQAHCTPKLLFQIHGHEYWKKSCGNPPFYSISLDMDFTKINKSTATVTIPCRNSLSTYL